MKTYIVEESVSGESATIQAENARQAVIEYLKKEYADGENTRVGAVWNWDFTVTRIRTVKAQK